MATSAPARTYHPSDDGSPGRVSPRRASAEVPRHATGRPGSELSAETGSAAAAVATCERGRRAIALDAFGRAAPEPLDPELDLLSAREREVLRYIARGYAYKEVAHELGISIKTVETHVSAVLRKLQLSSRYELSRWAADRRLI